MNVYEFVNVIVVWLCEYVNVCRCGRSMGPAMFLVHCVEITTEMEERGGGHLLELPKSTYISPVLAH